MYKILNQSPQNTEILLYSLIDGGASASQIIRQLKDADPSASITLRINSDGGEVFDAIAIYNYLKDKDVTVIIDGMCASAASIVAMCGREIIMKEGTMMMIHNPITFAIGDSEDIKNAAVMLDKVTELITDIYSTRASVTREEILALMEAQTWMTPHEALAYGFCTEIDAADPVREAEDTELAKNSFEDGVKAERERLQALDELYTPERAGVLNAAKYQTFQTAQDIAIGILKAEASIKPQAFQDKRESDIPAVTNFRVSDKDSQVIDAMSEYIARRRG